ncbi:MAG: acetoacetate decarboxylase family protein [Syntrophomonadales bacterium]|jgi:acetoacetate decarboxylase
MYNGSFLWTPEKGNHLTKGYPEANFQEGLFFVWLTKPDIIERILPPPLKMVAPIVSVYIINIGQPSYTQQYREAGLSIPAKYEDIKGQYVLSLLLAGPGAQMATLAGRETMGTPKKIADEVSITRINRFVRGYIERDGIRILDVQAEIGEYNKPEAAKIFGPMTPGSVDEQNVFFYKFDSNQDMSGNTTFSDCRLLRHVTRTRNQEWEKAKAEVILRPSVNDPWAELEVEEVLGLGYARNDLHMVATQTLCSVDSAKVVPYLLAGRYDVGFTGGKIRKF